jgi:hypothetical protein
MRFFEFAPVAQPVLKISQQQLAQQRLVQAGVTSDTEAASALLSSPTSGSSAASPSLPAPAPVASAGSSTNSAQQTTTPQPPASPKPTVKVYPRAWQHQWLQKYLAANMARDAQTVKPTEMDIIKAQMRFADVQRQADRDYQLRTGLPPPDEGVDGEHKWVKRDQKREVKYND